MKLNINNTLIFTPKLHAIFKKKKKISNNHKYYLINCQKKCQQSNYIQHHENQRF